MIAFQLLGSIPSPRTFAAAGQDSWDLRGVSRFQLVSGGVCSRAIGSSLLWGYSHQLVSSVTFGEQVQASRSLQKQVDSMKQASLGTLQYVGADRSFFGFVVVVGIAVLAFGETRIPVAMVCLRENVMQG